MGSKHILGIIPIPGSQVAVITGSLSVVMVYWSDIFNKTGIRNYTPKVKEIEGYIKFLALEAVKAKGGL